MIESCTKRRMILAITFLGGLTLLVLIVESHWTAGNGKNHVGAVGKNSSNDNNCWLREDIETVQPCHPCTDFEITSKSVGVCVATHFKETLFCKSSGKVVSRSCDKVTWLEERKFWIFEGSVFVVGVISTTFVFARQKILDHRMLRRIQRQLASGV
ncbi:protein JTB [Zootermopsis nevadensis]|uniref:protein JTB n=1 Tax=Zootermopsis nevadensis TaxID=136037 RepID=UPI000B8E85D8|nr:protein JTB [Zootermopsis nevadensis]